MGKLLEAFKQIDIGRKKCIDSLRAVNVEVPDEANLDVIATGIKQRSGEINIVKEQHMWERPEEWIDTKSILLNAPEIEGHTPFAVYLMYARGTTLTITFANSSNGSDGDDAYYLSDGTTLTRDNDGATVTHTWNIDKDIITNLGYNLRYAIAYVKNAKIDYWETSSSSFDLGSESQTGIGCCLLEIVAKNVVNSTRIALPIPKIGINYYSNVERIHILDSPAPFTAIGQSTGDYAIHELQIDYYGSYSLNKIYYLCEPGNVGNVFGTTKLLFPNITELLSSAGGTGVRIDCCYLYAPELVAINDSGQGSYGTIWAQFLYAPKLKTVTKNTNISPMSVQYIPNCIDTKNVSIIGTTDYYYDELFGRINTTSTLLPARRAGLFYNEVVEHLENTDTRSYNYVNCIILPNLKTLVNPSIFAGDGGKTIKLLVIGHGFKSNLVISNLVYLNGRNIIDILNKLADVNDEEQTYTLTLGSILLGKLSDEEKAIATNKGWVLE